MYNVEIHEEDTSVEASFFMYKKEDANMDNVIEVKPDKDGRYFVTLYGNKIELIPVKPATKPAKAEK